MQTGATITGGAIGYPEIYRFNWIWEKFANFNDKITSMASSKAFVDFILEQISFNGILDHRKMFGEYALYADGKVVALICDNKLYIKQTPEGRSFIGAALQEAPAYPGAKNSFLIEEGLEDRDWLSQLIAITAKALPEPKPKKKKA